MSHHDLFIVCMLCLQMLYRSHRAILDSVRTAFGTFEAKFKRCQRNIVMSFKLYRSVQAAGTLCFSPSLLRGRRGVPRPHRFSFSKSGKPPTRRNIFYRKLKPKYARHPVRHPVKSGLCSLKGQTKY